MGFEVPHSLLLRADRVIEELNPLPHRGRGWRVQRAG